MKRTSKHFIRSIFIALTFSHLLTGCGGGTAPVLFGNSEGFAFLVVADRFQYDYGAVLLGTATEQTFTVLNDGRRTATSITGSFTISAFQYKGGTYPGTGGTCTDALSPRSSCTIVVAFNPGYADQFTEFINLSYFNGEKNDLAITVELFGRGITTVANALDVTVR